MSLTDAAPDPTSGANTTDYQPVGHCSRQRSDDEARALIKNPSTIVYPWYDHATLRSAPRQPGCIADDIQRLRDAIAADQKMDSVTDDDILALHAL